MHDWKLLQKLIRTNAFVINYVYLYYKICFTACIVNMTQCQFYYLQKHKGQIYVRPVAVNKKSIRLIGVIYYSGMVLFVNENAVLCCWKVKWMISSIIYSSWSDVRSEQKFCTWKITSIKKLIQTINRRHHIHQYLPKRCAFTVSFNFTGLLTNFVMQKNHAKRITALLQLTFWTVRVWPATTNNFNIRLIVYYIVHLAPTCIYFLKISLAGAAPFKKLPHSHSAGVCLTPYNQ